MNHYTIAIMLVTMAGADALSQTPTSALERGGIVAILLAAVVVLWRQGQTEGRAARELLEKVLAHSAILADVGIQMKALSERLTNLHCPLLDRSDEDGGYSANGMRDGKSGPKRR